MNRFDRARSLGIAALVIAVGACDVLEVESPGRIADSDLNDRSAFPGLVAGMAFEATSAVNGTFEEFAMASGEIFHGGSYDFADIPRGVVLDEDVNGDWSAMQQARWVAEDGLRRMKEVLAAEGGAGNSPFIAEAALWAGLGNRLLGENLCSTAIDGGGEEPFTVHFTRAISHFDEAITVGQASGASAVVTAAYGGRASVKAWSGDWAGAVSDAMQVPASFVWSADFTNEVGNDLFFETNNRFEFSVWGTEFETRDPDDPRAPWEIIFNADGSVANGANGSTPMYRQLKYRSLSDDVPLVKGTEMLVLRAEAALETSSDIGGAIGLLNEARAVHGLDPLAVPASLDEAWEILRGERGATNWLESRRLWDRRRWFAKGAGSPAYDPFLEGRQQGQCWPISETEKRANDNLG